METRDPRSVSRFTCSDRRPDGQDGMLPTWSIKRRDPVIDQTGDERLARSADFARRQWGLRAKGPDSINCRALTHSHQMSRVAAAITIPVTNAAKQENSRRSFRTTLMAASPMRAMFGVPPDAVAHSGTVAEK